MEEVNDVTAANCRQATNDFGKKKEESKKLISILRSIREASQEGKEGIVIANSTHNVRNELKKKGFTVKEERPFCTKIDDYKDIYVSW